LLTLSLTKDWECSRATFCHAMKPESLLGVALELIQHLAKPGRLPADARVGRWFRERRFLGSKDRRFVSGAAYAWLRHFHRARPRWSSGLKRAPGLPEKLDPERNDPGTILADLATLSRDGLFPWSLNELIGAARGLANPPIPPAELTPDWAEGSWPEDAADRRAAEWSLPRWLADRLLAERGEAEAHAVAMAFLEPATVDIRVSLSRTTREAAREDLERAAGAPVELTPWSPAGLRLHTRANVQSVMARSRAALEVADEGSQIVVQAVLPKPGDVVIDACAGAGGKTLALAEAVLEGGRHGRVFACDTNPERMEELKRRSWGSGLERAIRVVPVAPEGPFPGVLEPADLVLVDAPCSGLGTLRRNPDLKRRHGPDDIRAFATTQQSILRRFAPLVKPGGRLAYATCSILAEENDDIARSFASEHGDFAEWRSPWARERLPEACWRGNWLILDPWRTRTDGFFLAVWERQTGSQSLHACP